MTTHATTTTSASADTFHADTESDLITAARRVGLVALAIEVRTGLEYVLWPRGSDPRRSHVQRFTRLQDAIDSCKPARGGKAPRSWR